MKMPRILAGALVCVLVGLASASTYYVDATSGNDSNDGQSVSTAWKTIAKVNAASFAPGDQILFKRGEVWRESLVPPSSGASGNTIKFDAYGSGEAPTITGYLDLPTASWSLDSGNIWKASVTSTSFNYILFRGSVWGLKHTTGKSSCVAPYDFYFASNVLYVYATANPATYYGSVAAMLMTNFSISSSPTSTPTDCESRELRTISRWRMSTRTESFRRGRCRWHFMCMPALVPLTSTSTTRMHTEITTAFVLTAARP
jgi:hypothetical protein